jgi:hypothetical protein
MLGGILDYEKPWSAHSAFVWFFSAYLLPALVCTPQSPYSGSQNVLYNRNDNRTVLFNCSVFMLFLILCALRGCHSWLK